MVSLDTEQDRTLFFDFLPLDLGSVKGFKTRFQLYTVPGQVYYNSTRKLVLRGVDGIVFVADSQSHRMAENMESLQNLKMNLQEYNLKLEDMPFVMQYNKRDLEAIFSIDELEQKLNYLKSPYFESTAHNGVGVIPTLKEIAKLVIDKFNRRPAVSPNKVAPNPAPTPVPTPVSTESVEGSTKMGSDAKEGASGALASSGVIPSDAENLSLKPQVEQPSQPQESPKTAESEEAQGSKDPSAEGESTFSFKPPEEAPTAPEQKAKLNDWDDDVDDDFVELIPYTPKKK
jgi:signal recognition particle receptor subunit beta